MREREGGRESPEVFGKVDSKVEGSFLGDEISRETHHNFATWICRRKLIVKFILVENFLGKFNHLFRKIMLREIG